MNLLTGRKSNRCWLVLLPYLLLPTESAFAQYVEVSLGIDQTFWRLDPSGQLSEKRRTNSAQCVFGPNFWFIEGEFTLNGKQTWWCTASNIVTQTVITKQVPEFERRAMTLGIPHVGEKFVRVYGPSDSFHLSGIGHVTWLAFCSGSFLMAEGRRVLPPFLTGTDDEGLTDSTQTFPDAFSLPKNMKIYRDKTNLVCVYEVQQSTNFAGGSVPAQFELTQYRDSGKGTMERWWRVMGTVTSMRETSRPPLPPEAYE